MVACNLFLVCARCPEDVGLVIPVLEDAGCEAELTYRQNRHRGKSFDQSRHTGLIILGDQIAIADDPTVYGKEEESWIRTVRQSGKAVLGICHGAQVLAVACGGGLMRGRGRTEKGLRKVELTKDGEMDPVVCHVKGAKVPQWHSYAFEFPVDVGAVDLARSKHEKWPHIDAFRIDRNLYGLQFHPEPDVTALKEYNLERESNEVLLAVEQTGRAVLRAWVEIALHSGR